MFEFHSVLTKGNVDNNHFYIPRECISALPKDVLGGRNASYSAKKNLEIEYGSDVKVQTDIDGTKRIFRKRGWQRELISRCNLVAGDTIQITLLGGHRLKVRGVKKSRVI